MAPPTPSQSSTIKQISKRSRWATRKMTIKSSGVKRLSLIGRIQRAGSSAEKKRASAATGGIGSIGSIPEQQEEEEEEEDDAGDGPGPRTLFFNLPLPPEMKDENDEPIAEYTRNKIRTAKYTPLSFIPKNLFLQFHNIANIYFLFLVVLAFFPIFGSANPGLGAVPIIFIVVVTAIKDAIEDSRRTMSDNELNDSTIHRLCGWNNVNVKEDDVSAWRKFKKANTKVFGGLWHVFQGLVSKEARERNAKRKADQAALTENARMSTETRRPRPQSMLSAHNRASFVSAREDIQMTPVPSPLPRAESNVHPLDRPHEEGEVDGRPSGFSFRGNSSEMMNIKTDLINHAIPAEGKARFRRDKWKNLQVGDFVRIYNNDELPADVVILSTSDPEAACYIETKNLDGETNLKFRTALRCGQTIKNSRDCERAQFVIESEAPQPNLYKYNGAIKWKQAIEGDPSGSWREMSEPITIDNTLLRGCNLRNTDWVLGVVIFTGHDTKIMMNAGITPTKRPRIARELNYHIICNFLLVLIICLVSAIANGFAFGRTNSSITYFEYGSIGGTPAMTGFITFWAAVILFQNLVPISLYISLEIVRLLQAFFIYSDVGMYYEAIDQPCIPKSWNISDDLGQIEYIFSDKTGTLTQNLMEFKKATINGQPYGEAYTEALAGLHRRMGIDVVKEAAEARIQIQADKVKALSLLREIHDNPYLHEEDLQFIAPDFVEDLTGGSGQEQQAACERFMLALALCHTVIPERQPGEKAKMMYKAQSPDEAALVATARDMGFTVLSCNSDGIRLNVMGEEKYYPILNTIEFNSSRKRMSAIIRMQDGSIMLFCKGADSIIYSRLKKGEQQELRKTTAEHLEMFAREGLRTLCIAERALSENEYTAWRAEHDKAATALEDREDKMEAVADTIEQELSLIGGTAIEDRLQDGVPDTIAVLAEAGIKLWVLTGDKVETAINIGFSCNLLNNDMELLNLKVDEDETGATPPEQFMESLNRDLDRHLSAFGLTGSDEDLAAAILSHEAPPPTHAVIVDGFTLRYLLEDTLKQKFLLLCKQCKSVLCCRVSPAQKAAVCALVKNGLDVMTLSIGDGANDVAMIQEADVGVGIAGVEGRQAVMSSDYAIAQFSYLQRLVLVHGRWSYRRVAECIHNFFYKSMVSTTPIFWFQVFCDFDQTYLFDYTYILAFNLFFTSVPVILMGVLDQDVSDAVSLAVPQLYQRGIERLEWTRTKFWLYMADGIYQGIMSFFIPYLVLIGSPFVTHNGLDVSDRLRLGAYVAHPAVITINLYILLNTYQWDRVMLSAVAISNLFIFFWTGVFTMDTYSGQFYKSAPQLYAQPSFWAVFIITPVMCVFPRFAIKALQKVYWPYDVDIIREQVQLGKFCEVDPAAGQPLLPGRTTVGSSPSLAKGQPGPFSGTDDDQRPIYPPSVATHTRTQTGSDGTNYTGHRMSMEQVPMEQAPMETVESPVDRAPTRPSMDRARPSYDRIRASMDRVRPSYEASNDFTSAARLSRVESTRSRIGGPPPSTSNMWSGRLRGLSMISAKSRIGPDAKSGTP
ncbi:phospholipid-transporting ATPase 1 [Gaeumannomyces tritici R3-111a-1]|uniref:Phospholipid-transporting ATPase n=1 Tax=Gaeumannomyces tritici (strain R3-111a-1) TaxID=644352 RepID=J3PDR2_GAET3|nr:phospholipid-transporting ATPase 1 [Gaeumannomyces tritici R3-111a-1]EJT70612.1 phospholipid-transporting ATPase 1 [Gaeumannomyces tritici R3-111a-1]